MALYTFRSSSLTPTRAYKIKESSLEIRAQNGKEEITIPFEKITHIHLAYNASMRAIPETYFMTVKAKGFKKVEIKNLHFESFGRFEDRRTAYVAFIKELHQNLATYKHIQFKSGVGHTTFVFSYFILCLCFVAFFTGLALMAYGVLLQGALLSAATMFLGNKLRKYITVNRPQKYMANSIPEFMIPTTRATFHR